MSLLGLEKWLSRDFNKSTLKVIQWQGQGQVRLHLDDSPWPPRFTAFAGSRNPDIPRPFSSTTYHELSPRDTGSQGTFFPK